MKTTVSATTPPPCIPGFEQINRYWDRQRKIIVAKILPGEFYVSLHDEAIATTLGSCVSACIWDEHSGIGGMNHFMLPMTSKDKEKITWGNVASDATRYGNYAMEHLINVILQHGGLRQHLKAKIFGGGKILKQMNNVGEKNVDFVIDYLRTEKIDLIAEDLHSDTPRKVLFMPKTGSAFVKKLGALHNDTIIKRETNYKEELTTENLEGDIELF